MDETASEPLAGEAAGSPAVATPGPPAIRKRNTAPAKRRRKAKRRTQVRWSAKREAIFLTTLGETSCVAAAIRASGLSETNVYRRRRQQEEFRARWAAALREGYHKLEAMMLERALNGVEKAVWHGGAKVGTITEYNDRTALALLNLHRATVIGARPMAAETSVEEQRAALRRRLTELTPRFALPLLQAGQAQKEATHNEAIVALELLAQPIVETVGDDAPPSIPIEGNAWIVGTAPTGAWAGHAGALAAWTAGGWRFVAPCEGMVATVRATGWPARRGPSSWATGVLAAETLALGGMTVVGARQPAIAEASGGATIDLPARNAIGAILAALRTHGLIAS